MKFKVVIESSNDGLWGRWEHRNSLVVGQGMDLEELKSDFIDGVNLYFEELKQPHISLEEAQFEFHADPEHYTSDQ